MRRPIFIVFVLARSGVRGQRFAEPYRKVAEQHCIRNASHKSGF
jgi:hypothetical protein